MSKQIVRTWIKNLGEQLLGGCSRRMCRSRFAASKRREPTKVRPMFDTLEDRIVPNGTWTELPSAPATGTMLLQPNGTVMVSQSNGSSWYQLTPDALGNYTTGTWSYQSSMSTPRLYFGSAVLPNDNVMVYGGEYTGGSTATEVNSGEIYNPNTNLWTPIPSIPAALDPANEFGDGALELLPNGNVIAQNINGPSTYIYNPTTSTWSAGPTKGDSSSEETWIKLPGTGGNIVDYEIWASNGAAPGYGEYLNTATNTWTATGSVPVALSENNEHEIGPGILLPNGDVFQIGANGDWPNISSNTALYDPVANTWTAGPVIPDDYIADDAPAAILPDGNVIFVADTSETSNPTYQYTGPSAVFEYDYVSNTITQLTGLPTALNNDLTSSANNYANSACYNMRMLVLPTGQVLFSDGSNLWTYSESTAPNPAWAPTITNLTNNGSGSFTLTGTQLNGIDEGASYGDDAQMATDFPIVQVTDSFGNVFYAQTYNWSLPGTVATGNTSESTQFTLPAGVAPGDISVAVIANGIPSTAVPASTFKDWIVTDPNGAPGSGSENDVTLPFAVANAQNGDSIAFSPCLDGSTITLGATLTISSNIEITGPGAAKLAISGGGAVQDFFVDSGVYASLFGLTIENGTETGLGGGGGILNTGSLTVDQCVISGNNGASAGTYNSFGSGGGILNVGNLGLYYSTLENNTANYGGGLANYGGAATTSIDDCTFTANTGSSAGGVVNFGGGTLNLSNSTVAYNNGFGAANISTMDNCIVAGNTSGQINGGTPGTFTLTDVVGLATTLAYNNGAPTPTFALLPGSSALGIGDPAQAGLLAQNGVVRPGVGVAVGACQGGYDWVVTDPNGNAASGSPGDITLPYAIAHADSGDQITFSTSLSGDTIPLDSTLTLSQNVTITGPGAANLAISGGGAVQDFFVNSGVSASISGLTIEDGTETGLGGGGGILNEGSLTVTDCLIAYNNGASGGSVDPWGSGGGILNTGFLSLGDSTIANNTANYGGGLESYGPGAFTLINDCTFTANTGGSGAGVNNFNGGYLGLTNSTVAFNNGYGVYVTYMDNCIVADNSSGDIYSGTSGSFTLTGGVALVPTLAYNNGGATPTLALLPGSSAIGAGDPAQAGTTAQNGAVRTAGSVDVGACQGGFNWVVTDPNGNAGSGSGADITLPFAIANAQNGDTITFDSCMSGATITLNSTLTLSHAVTITGPGAANLAVSGGGAVQDFLVNAEGCVSISGLTIENGMETGLGGGGGILNTGMLTVSDCVISGNNGVSGGTYDVFGSGGGILNTGMLALHDSTIENNIANYGGGLENYNQGSTTIDDCTFVGNTSILGSAAGVNNYDGGPLTLSNSTIAYNNGYGVYVTAMNNCIVAGNTGGAIYAGVSGTYTLTSVTGLATTLAYNGGPTPTLALSPGSSALGVGDPTQAGTTAQNGVIRPAGNVAVGAFQGADWVVTDPNGNAGSGSPADITLPYAVANAQDGDSITFASNLSGDTIVLNSTLTIDHNYTITGLGSANLAVSGGSSVQDFVVNSGVTTSISDLTIENGLAAQGAGINNSGMLSLVNDAVSDNATLNNAIAGYNGAGIYNSGILSVDGSTINGNSAYTNGGGVYNTGTATLSNSTIFGNSAYTEGGGLFNSGTLTLISDTVSGNVGYGGNPSLPFFGGGVFNSGILQMDNTIVAGNASSSTTGPDVYGTIAVANYCLIGTGAGYTITTGKGNLTASAGLTTTLAYNNNAPTQTLALMPGSQALGAGDPNQAGSTAQNGITRAAGAVDIGACQGGVTWIVTDPSGSAGSGSPLDITLPYAVSHAQDGDTITFAGSLSGNTILLDSTLTISHDYTITGLGSANLAVSGGGSVQDFAVTSCATIMGLTIEDGLAADGAGINNSGMLTLLDDAVSNNATLNDFVAGYDGAGIYNSGILSVYGTTINGNSAYTNGGGIYNRGTATLSNSTIFGNAAWTAGGGIFNSGNLTLINDTVADNAGYGGSPFLPSYGGGIYNGAGATLQMDNTIVAGNGSASTNGPDVFGTIAVCNYCLIGNPSGATYSGTGNLTGSAGLAAALAYNGGPTQTLALLAGSQAIGAGDPGQAGTFAQNGVLRPGAPAIGAYQPAAPPPGITSVVINQDLPALYNAAGQPTPGAQRSMVDDVVYTFSEPVNILSSGVDPNVFTIAVAAGWTGTAPTLNWAPVSGSGDTQWAVTFSGASVSGGSIANGAYTITVNDPSAITAVSDSQALVLQATGIGSATQSFFRLFGDINGDEFVNAADNAKFKQALTTFNAAFDFNGDSIVNAFDNAKFKSDLTVGFSGFTPTI